MKLVRTAKTILVSAGLVFVLSLFSTGAIVPVAHAAGSSANTQTKKSKVTHKKITKTEAIKFSSKTVEDATLPKGQTKVTQKGVNGKKKVTYNVTYLNGKATKWQAISTKVITKPLQQIKSIGTYIAPAPEPAASATSAASQPTCTNGTYVNSAGNTVCSPEAAPSAPAGATAQCYDGTYSFSQSRSGTCSHHGGVATWL